MSETYDLFQMGKRHLAADMPAQATVALEKAKRREPGKASIREALGLAYYRLYRYKEAEREFRAVIEITPTDDYAYFVLGCILEKRGRAAEARGQFKLARALKPTSALYDERAGSL